MIDQGREPRNIGGAPCLEGRCATTRRCRGGLAAWTRRRWLARHIRQARVPQPRDKDAQFARAFYLECGAAASAIGLQAFVADPAPASATASLRRCSPTIEVREN